MSETSAIRRSLASIHGASGVFNPLSVDVVSETFLATDGCGADVVFDCAGVPAGMDNALSAVRIRGNIVIIAVWEQPMNIDFNRISFKEVIFTGEGIPWSMSNFVDELFYFCAFDRHSRL